MSQYETSEKTHICIIFVTLLEKWSNIKIFLILDAYFFLDFYIFQDFYKQNFLKQYNFMFVATLNFLFLWTPKCPRFFFHKNAHSLLGSLFAQYRFNHRWNYYVFWRCNFKILFATFRFVLTLRVLQIINLFFAKIKLHFSSIKRRKLSLHKNKSQSRTPWILNYFRKIVYHSSGVRKMSYVW